MGRHSEQKLNPNPELPKPNLMMKEWGGTKPIDNGYNTYMGKGGDGKGKGKGKGMSSYDK